MFSAFAAAFMLSAVHIRGQQSEITFGMPDNRAILRASCEADEASIRSVAPQGVVGIPTGNVTLHFLNVLPTCVNAPVRVPCARESQDQPALFYIHWTGTHGSFVHGPVAVSREADYLDGVMLAVAVRVSVPWPSHDSIVDMTGYNGVGSTVFVNVSVTHFAASGFDALPVPFRGLPGGNAISISGLPTPPSAPFPVSPPRPNAPPNPPPSSQDTCFQMINSKTIPSVTTRMPAFQAFWTATPSSSVLAVTITIGTARTYTVDGANAQEIVSKMASQTQFNNILAGGFYWSGGSTCGGSSNSLAVWSAFAAAYCNCGVQEEVLLLPGYVQQGENMCGGACTVCPHGAARVCITWE